MIKTVDNTNIPEWLRSNMQWLCKCGYEIVDDGPVGADGVMKLTQRWCSNPNCPYHMAEKVVMLARRFGIDGIGPATAREMIRIYKFKSHLDALRFWFAEKPSVYLYEVAEMAYIYGTDSKWKEWLGGYTSIDEYVRKVRFPEEEVLMNREYIEQCCAYFNVKGEALNSIVLKVMITGSIDGFSSRQEFLSAVNNHYKDHFRIEDNKKTVRDTICLIREPYTADHSKSDIAIRNGIPILNSKEFIAMLDSIIEEGGTNNADA